MSTTATVTHECGRFKLWSDGSLTGPKEYLDSDAFRACIGKIGAGRPVVYNHPSGQPHETRMLVASQTDDAGWPGANERAAMCGRS